MGLGLGLGILNRAFKIILFFYKPLGNDKMSYWTNQKLKPNLLLWFD